MNKIIVLALVVVAALVVAIAVLYLSHIQQSYPKTLNISKIEYQNGIYLYNVIINNQNKVPLIYVYYNRSILIGLLQQNSTAYALFAPQRLSEMYQTPNASFYMIGFPGPLGFFCSNFTISQRIAGVPVFVSNQQCSTQPFSAPSNFVDVASALSQVPPPSVLSFAGTAPTPFGTALIYKNNTSITYLFYSMNFTYIIYLINNIIYKYEVLVPLGQTTINVTYVLRSISPINSTYLSIISNLSGNMPVRDMGGLSLVAAARKIGMVIQNGTPTVLAFLALNDTSSAKLFIYNYSLLSRGGLILLDYPGQPTTIVERLRCAYLASKSNLLNLLKKIYINVLENSSNLYTILPNNTCSVDLESEAALLGLALQGLNIPSQSAPPPVLLIVYPNGTYTAVIGYNPSALESALG